MTGYLILIFVCLFFSAFYAAAETAYNFANENHLAAMAEQGSRLYKLALYIARHYNFALTANLVGVNIAHFGMSACVTLAVYEVFTTHFTGNTEGAAAAVATLLTTVVMLIFGEIIPKTFAAQRGDRFSAIVAVPVFLSIILFSPVVFLINGIVSLISRPLAKEEALPVTDDELSCAIEQSEEEGGIEENKSELLQSAIDFQDADIRRLVVPRVDMVAFDRNDPVDDLIRLVKETVHSRIPVYEDTVDNITGILYANRFLLELAAHGKEGIDLDKCIKPPCIIYPSASLPDALDELRRCKMQLAVVPDEYGGTLGIVTMEDILEELVGEIDDETDPEEQEDIIPVTDDRYEVSGDISLHDAMEGLGRDDEEVESDYATLGGWVIEQLDGFPEVGKSFDFRNMTVTVTEMDGTRVSRVSFDVRPDEEDTEEA